MFKQTRIIIWMFIYILMCWPVMGFSSEQTQIRAVLFDVFGTVVDWHGTLIDELDQQLKIKNMTHVSSEAIVQDWVEAYSANMRNINKGLAPFETVDVLNQKALDKTLEKYGILNQFSLAQRNHMWMTWHRLKPWPDAVEGIDKIKNKYIVGPLSNGNVRLLIDLSKHANLHWDVILSGEMLGYYKPNLHVYRNAAKILNLKPSEILLVASHPYDLKAAQQCGFKTAYIYRPHEFGVVAKKQDVKKNDFDFSVTSITELAGMLE
jgi:2-haloacid dehalogenase